MEVIFVRHAQTYANYNKVSYTLDDSAKINNLTKRGIAQAIHTGKYLKKIYGKFDIIISSPRSRTIHTSRIIANEIKYNNDIFINNLIEEPYPNKCVVGLTKSEFNKFYEKSDINQLEKKYNSEPNPYKKKLIKIELNNLYSNLFFSSIDNNNNNIYDQILENLKIFLNFLKKLKYKRILIVSHGGIIPIIQKIITNTLDTEIQMIVSEHTLKVPHNHFENGNTMLMACFIKDKTISLVEPVNTLHLSNFEY